jgi:hypothetical protein
MNVTEIRCSKLSRIMSCSGLLFFKDLPEEEPGVPAKEGTACGEVLQARLEGRPIPTVASNGVPVDEDMKFYTAPIAEEILARAGTEVLCEKRIDWNTRSNIAIRGQYDASFVGKDGRLYIDDLKYGWGIVEVRENWQLLGYAIGEVIRRGQAFERIVLRIHQPRPHHEDGSTREWELSYEELCGYMERIEARMSEIAQGHNELVTGKHCKYCPAAGQACPAISKQMFWAIDWAHAFVEDKLTEEELSRQLQILDRMTEVMKIKSDSLKTLAIDRIKRGAIIPGYVTEQSFSDRKWKPGIDPEVIKAFVGKDITERVILSPNKAEKLGVPKELVNHLVDRQFLGVKLKQTDAGAMGDRIFGKEAPRVR